MLRDVAFVGAVDGGCPPLHLEGHRLRDREAQQVCRGIDDTLHGEGRSLALEGGDQVYGHLHCFGAIQQVETSELVKKIELPSRQ